MPGGETDGGGTAGGGGGGNDLMAGPDAGPPAWPTIAH